MNSFTNYDSYFIALLLPCNPAMIEFSLCGKADSWVFRYHHSLIKGEIIFNAFMDKEDFLPVSGPGK
jgi:hypothetical protein